MENITFVGPEDNEEVEQEAAVEETMEEEEETAEAEGDTEEASE